MGRNILIGLLVCAAVLSGSWADALAARRVLEEDRMCSLTLSFQNSEGTPIRHVAFRLYKVAGVKNHRNDLSYDMSLTDFAGSGVELGDLSDKTLGAQLALYAEKNGVSGTEKETDIQGELCFDGLPVGLYLVAQAGENVGYYPMEPFLISLPVSSEDGSEWVYDAKARPKAEIRNLPVVPVDLTVRKVWADNSGARWGSVSVYLFRGAAVYDTVTLSTQNNWMHTWHDLDGNYQWTVREAQVPAGYKDSYITVGDTVTITNTRWLIQTGPRAYLPPALAGGGLALLLLGWVLLSAGKKRKP